MELLADSFTRNVDENGGGGALMWDQDPSLNFRMSCKVCFRWSSEKGGLGVHYSMCALGSYVHENYHREILHNVQRRQA